MISDALHHLGHRLATGLLAKDWPDDPVYLLHSSQFGEAGRAINGFACHRSHLFRAALGESWEGPGRIIIVNDANLARLSEGRSEEYLEHRYLAVVTHEAGHCVLFEIEPPDSDLNMAAELCYEMGRELPLTAR